MAKREEDKFKSELSREEMEQMDADKLYIGFDNSTLLPVNNQTQDKIMYTTGIIGCTGLVLSGTEGTYMAHIQDSELEKANDQDVYNVTSSVIETYNNKLGSNPETAYIIEGSEPNLNMNEKRKQIAKALEEKVEDIDLNYHSISTYGIRIGATESEHNKPKYIGKLSKDDHQWAIQNNLLPHNQLSWGGAKGMLNNPAFTKSQTHEYNILHTSNREDISSSNNNSNFSYTEKEVKGEKKRGKETKGYGSGPERKYRNKRTETSTHINTTEISSSETPISEPVKKQVAEIRDRLNSGSQLTTSVSNNNSIVNSRPSTPTQNHGSRSRKGF